MAHNGELKLPPHTLASTDLKDLGLFCLAALKSKLVYDVCVTRRWCSSCSKSVVRALNYGYELIVFSFGNLIPIPSAIQVVVSGSDFILHPVISLVFIQTRLTPTEGEKKQSKLYIKSNLENLMIDLISIAKSLWNMNIIHWTLWRFYVPLLFKKMWRIRIWNWLKIEDRKRSKEST